MPAGSISRKFYHLWSINPVLNFDPHQFPQNKHMGFADFVDSTLNRYSTDKIVIKKFKLHIEISNNLRMVELGKLIDKWVEIAVKNEVVDLELGILPFRRHVSKKYTMPSIVLSAKSLKYLKLCNLEFPSSDNLRVSGGSMKLRFLEYLLLRSVHFRDDSLLRHMISSCPLVFLKISSCSGVISEININQLCKIRSIHLCQDENVNCEVGLINLDSSNLEVFMYYAAKGSASLRISDPARLSNLRKIFISSTPVVNYKRIETVFSGLPLLEHLILHKCSELSNPKLSSFSLKEFKLEFCPKLKVEIDAPQLVSFLFAVYLDDEYPIILLSKCSACCKASVTQGRSRGIDTSFFVKIRKFLVQSGIFDVLSLSVQQLCKVEFKVKSMSDMPPEIVSCNLQLELCPSTSTAVENSVPTLIEGLLWSCKPNILSLPMSMKAGPTHLSSNTNVCKVVMEKLGSCAVAWEHPLKGVEVKSVDTRDVYDNSLFNGLITFHFNLKW